MKSISIELHKLLDKYSLFKAKEITGRYVTFSHLEPLLKEVGETHSVKQIGLSTNGIPIHTVTAGQGVLKVLAWSQMHGNESTTTKALFDVFKAMQLFSDEPVIKLINEKITIKVIPMLNPDGALNYNRENANQTDLNRDALRLKEVESKILRKTFMDFDPNFCLNLHDQRTIFSAGLNPVPATLSFLTPAMDEKRIIYPERIISMKIIAAMAADLEILLPTQIGRYSDEFNPNCTGDTFQSLGKPTILFEAGHSPGDYHREKTRQYVAAAILSSLVNIATGNWKNYDLENYLKIPENNKLFYDLILRNAVVNGEIQDVAIQYKEVLSNNEIEFQPLVEKVGASLPFFCHKEIDCENKLLTFIDGKQIPENVIVNKLLLNNEVLAINYQNI